MGQRRRKLHSFEEESVGKPLKKKKKSSPGTGGGTEGHL